jgi:hypothetical protein
MDNCNVILNGVKDPATGVGSRKLISVITHLSGDPSLALGMTTRMKYLGYHGAFPSILL